MQNNPLDSIIDLEDRVNRDLKLQRYICRDSMSYIEIDVRIRQESQEINDGTIDEFCDRLLS